MSSQQNSQLKYVLTHEELPKIFLKYQNIQSSPPKQVIKKTYILQNQLEEISKNLLQTPSKEKKNIFDQQKSPVIQHIFNPRMAQGFDKNQVQQDQYYPVDFSASRQEPEQSSLHEAPQIVEVQPQEPVYQNYEETANQQIMLQQEIQETNQLKVDDELNPYQQYQDDVDIELQQQISNQEQQQIWNQEQPKVIINEKAEQNARNFENLTQVLQDLINKFNINSKFHTKQFIQLLNQCHEITLMISQSDRLLIVQNKMQILEHFDTTLC